MTSGTTGRIRREEKSCARPFAWDALVDTVHAVPTGQPDRRHTALRRRGGIPYSRGEAAELQKEAATAGIAPLAVSDQPLDYNSA